MAPVQERLLKVREGEVYVCVCESECVHVCVTFAKEKEHICP